MQITKFLNSIEETLKHYEKEISNASEKKDQVYSRFLNNILLGIHKIIVKIDSCLSFKEKYNTKKNIYQKIKKIEEKVNKMINKTEKDGYPYLLKLREKNQEVKQEDGKMH